MKQSESKTPENNPINQENGREESCHYLKQAEIENFIKCKFPGVDQPEAVVAPAKAIIPAKRPDSPLNERNREDSSITFFIIRRSSVYSDFLSIAMNKSTLKYKVKTILLIMQLYYSDIVYPYFPYLLTFSF